MLIKYPLTPAYSPFLVETTHSQNAERSLEERQDVLDALKRVIMEAFALYMETKSLHWLLAHSSFFREAFILDKQAELIFVGIDELVLRARGLHGTVIYQGPKTPFWQIIAGDRDNDEDIAVKMQRLIKDHRRLAKRMREAMTVCYQNHDRESREALQKVLIETEIRTQRFLSILDQLPAMSASREVSQ